MSPPVTRVVGRGRTSKRPAYLNAYVLDGELGEPPNKSPKLHLSVDAFEDAEEPTIEQVEQNLSQEELNLEGNEEQEENRIMEERLASLITLVNSMQTSVEGLRTEMITSIANVNQRIDSVQSQNVVNNMQTTSTQPQNSVGSQPQSEGIAATPVSNNSSFASLISGRKALLDLPQFSGEYDQWPDFIADFEDTTATEGYSTVQNNVRLKKCLTGEARKCVSTMLIHHQNVPEVINRLRSRYGCPEKIIQSQIDKIKSIAPISENRMDLLVSFADDVNNMKNLLKACESEHCLSDSTLLKNLVLKMPYSKRWEWQKHKASILPYATIEHFSDWLNGEAEVADGVDINVPVPSSSKATHQKKERVLLVKANKPKLICIVCQKDHKAIDCDKFAQMSLNARWELAAKEKFCFKCLEKGHQSRICRQKPCGIDDCRRPHHKLLHESSSNLNANAATFQPVNVDHRVVNAQTTEESNVLFKVIPITLYGPKGEKNTLALLDEASTLTLMHKELAKELGLHGKKGSISIKGIDNVVKIKDSEIVDPKISGTYSEAPIYNLVGVRVVDGLDLPIQQLDLPSLSSKFKHLQNLPLQDFNGLPEILIGLKHAHLGAPIHVPLHKGHGPILIQTKLGYLLYGPKDGNEVCEQDIERVLLCDVRPTLDELHNMVQQHYTIEDFGVRCVEQVQSAEDRRALEIFEKTTSRIEGGFESGLLWSKDAPLLPDSYTMAKKRLLSIERKMTKDEDYAVLYRRTIADYLEKKYARELTFEESQTEPERTWYLPHFGVVNPNKPGKFRLVFDGAATVNGTSLNSTLLTGPDLNQSLVKVLWRFRERSVGVCGDIREMYHQIRIIPEDIHSQRFLWRWSPNEPIKKFVMDAMTFGSTSSPTTAQFVKNKNALEFSDNHPVAVDAILQSHYVDDYVSCYSNEDEAISITKEVIEIHAKGGFELRNFTSNSKKVVEALNGTIIPSLNMDIEHENHFDKILGLHWNVYADSFTFQLKFSRIPKDILELRRHPTKREMLSFAMSIYDPFGFIANLSIHIKVLVQDIWRAGISWDEPVPDSIYSKWCLWFEQLEKVKEVNIPRCYSPNLFEARIIELHTMVDSSEVAFCAVSYLRVVFGNHTELAFVAGKTKCAPLKELSVPRLELQAAVLGSRLTKAIRDSHSFKIDRCFFWSDSMTVLYWLKDSRCRFKPYVRNRVSEILDASVAENWRYVPTNDNVADDSTRDVYPPMFYPESRWTKGPEWLFDEESWPKQPSQFSSNAPVEEIHRVMLTDMTRNSFDVTNFSSYWRLKRIVAWILRFIYYLKSKKTVVVKCELLPSEINRAEEFLCRQAQMESFQEDYFQMQKGIKAKKMNPNLIKLMPYLDEKEVMRVSGRIDNAPMIPVFTKRPIVMSKDSHLSFLIVKYFHELYHHQFDELTISEVKYRFWIISVRTVLQQVKKNCAFCINKSASPDQPMMGQLPKDRLTPYVRPFSYCGVDYFGPINVAIGRRREKRWVALFTCATIRAVHLEISENLSSDSFILCLRNFINLRGVPVRLRSDNGTNFIGARNEIIKSAEFFGDAGIQRESSSKGIEWLFNTPGNPEAGGIWERLVQTVKRVLKPLLKDVAPRTETLRSFLLEAANIVNSRPLTHLPISHQDEDPMTPNLFLLGCPNSIQTVGSTDERLWCLRKQWRISQGLKNHFWKRFIREYLPTLTRREKWCQRAEPLKVGDIVLMCEDDVPRGNWRKGMVDEVVMAKDGQVRTAVVRVNGATYRRPASKLAVLDIQGRTPKDLDDSTGGGMSPTVSE